MAKHPDDYSTRYTKLTGKHRTVFKAVGPLAGVEFEKRLAMGELFYRYCEQVRGRLKDWVSALPETATKIPELTEPQRQLLRLLRGPGGRNEPPQLWICLALPRNATQYCGEIRSKQAPPSMAGVLHWTFQSGVKRMESGRDKTR